MALQALISKSFIFTIFAFLCILLAHVEVQGFTLIRSGSGVTAMGWGSSTVTFDIDSSCNSVLGITNSAIDKAISVWGAVPTSKLEVVRGSTVTLASPITTYVGSSATSYAPEGNAIVYCDSNFGTHSGADANSIPGFATGQNFSSSGTINGCLLVLNIQSGAAANIQSLNETLVETILTHEIGHCLGLGHSSDTEALMYYATGAGRGTYLARDDMDGVTYLYPIQELSTSFPGCSAIASTRKNQTPKPGGRNNGWGYYLGGLGSDIILGLLILVVFRLFRVRHRRPSLRKF